ncbi:MULTISPECIES: ShlB/FhaC/HecB family hemolysin secretion/activation protein [unclassified Gilliamella]|uniref:ShlB/FhaC/HecB family hemolysin secretion/activation protein n=1 Tax=unclassified Gilliamella TaxID=2685620 RepID=UPI001C6A2599|nr:ShlB/FhaC/HecB family hemolysin secretion/activation protein [Gilliamella sp. ESL0441]QYN45046.1 ShlB/FhaC/HecB family hemolysin secretion/activation protein [Gilliamella sp. ESL0441]
MKIRTLSIIIVSFIISSNTSARQLPTPEEQKISNQQLIYQQERQKATEEALSSRAPKVSLSSPIKNVKTIDFPEEQFCFPIQHVELLERDNLPFTIPLNSLAKQAEGRCLGGKGLNLLMTELQNQLIGYGYITTRVLAPQQDLNTGIFKLLLLKGTVQDIIYTSDSDQYASLMTTMPLKRGDLLNLRAIEQGLENLQRIPTASAQIELVPGSGQGESNIIIKRKQSKYWRLGLSFDNSGTKDTGRNQGGLTFYLDNPLGLSDSFYVSGGHDLEGRSKYGSKNYIFSYSVPYGYWLLDASIYGNTYHQKISGIVDYEYKGRSKYYNLQLSRVLHRNESQKTILSYGVNMRESSNYLNDIEIEIQHRKTSNWQLGLQHSHYIDNIVLYAGAWYQKGVRWFGAQEAPEEYAKIGSALTDIFKVNLSVYVPFKLANQNFGYSFDYNGQMTRRNKLTPPDRFSIGSRWTVRGFDGEEMLSADNGWYVRNELTWIAPINQQWYLGIDTGGVSGGNSEKLSGKRLIGSVVGVRGRQFGIYYDMFAGVPIYKPKKFDTNHLTLGFYFNWTY